jgi:DNA (cytosine-5)-methyltransferase 1
LETQRIESFSYVDLFAGCGGFSLGLESVGAELLFALERSPMAAETFMRNLIRPDMTDQCWRNHLEATIEEQIESKLVVSDIKLAKNNDHLTGHIMGGNLDLVVGGPPCQGFSFAGKRDSSDERNSLAWDFLDLVEKSHPKIVVIENVPGMNSKFATQDKDSKSVFSQLAEALAVIGDGYLVQKLQLNSLHFGAAQRRERLFLIGVREDIAGKLSISTYPGVWRSDFSDLLGSVPDLAPAPSARSDSVPTVRDAIADLTGSEVPSAYVNVLKDSEYWGLKKLQETFNHTPRSHGEATKLKFELHIALLRQSLDPVLMKDGLGQKLEKKREDALLVTRTTAKFPLVDTAGETLAENFEDLVALLERFKTKKYAQRILPLDSTPPTVITSPDDYLHPVEPRVLTVRELARFQGFSDHFRFFAKETTGGLKRRFEVPQYSQVGNAVSPFVSRAIGLLARDLLERLARY